MSETKEGRKLWRLLPVVAFVVAILLTASLALAGITRAGSLLGAPSGSNQQKTTGANKVTSELASKFAAAGPSAKLQYWVVMADQADTSNNIPNSQWAEKGWYVYNVLTKKASETQKDVITQLDQLTKSGDVTSFQSFWIVNLVAVTGNLNSANLVSIDAGVATVKVPLTGEINGDMQGQLSADGVAAVEQAAQDIQTAQKGSPLVAPLSPFIIQHNIDEVHAPQGWTLGFDGTGIVIGSMDTGTRWTHEALNARYRGVVAPPDPGNIHDYNWLDGYGTFTTPTDNNGHGSHTMGTALGTSPNATFGNIGVGKGAMWMTVRICATSSCDSTPILNGFQWTLAPTRVNGTQPNPAFRPRVSNNSWGSSLCTTADWTTAVTNWVNAGIFPDFSTGNSGPGAGSVGAPASYVNAWGTGNLNTSGGPATWVINPGSSRGPSCFDQSIRPHAIAPGTSICSSINSSDTAYSCGFTGTSMSAPHIAGAVAMLLQKNTNLTIDQLKFAITSTAFFSPTWGTRPNNNYGWGLLQVDAALNSVSGGGTATPTPTGSTATPTRTNTTGVPTATVCAATNYAFSVTTGATIVAGTNDIGNHTDDGSTFINLPFSYTLYDTAFTSVAAGSNGHLTFGTVNDAFNPTCIPIAGTTYMIAPYRTDQCTGTCTGVTSCTGCGIFTSTTGVAPNRIFNVEYRTRYYNSGGADGVPLNYEVRLFEGQNAFDVIYGTVNTFTPPAARVISVGVEKNNTAGNFTLVGCDSTGGGAPPVVAGQMYHYTLGACGTTTPVPPTSTPTGSVPTPTCSAGGSGTWTTALPYPIHVSRYGFAQVGNSFYVIGGVSDGSRVSNVNRYDVGANTWTALAPIPVASEAPACAYNSGANKIYCAQGDLGNSFQIYDVAANSWSSGPAVPGGSDRYGAAAGSSGNLVYIVGGSTSIQSDTQIYNIGTNSWSTGTPASVPLLLPGYQSVGQFLYVVGGFSGVPSGGKENAGSSPASLVGKGALNRSAAPDANNGTTLRLDMSTGTWSSGPAFTPGRADFGLAFSGGSLYAIGGDATGGGFFDSTSLVDSLSVGSWPAGSWATSPPAIPAPIRQANQAGFTSTDGRIWSTGGLNGSTFVFISDHIYRTQGSCTTPGTPVPSNTPTSGTVVPTATCATGGGTPGPWATSTVGPSARYRHTAVSLGSSVYLMGGGTSTGTFLNDLWRWDTPSQTWTQLANMPTGKQNAQAALWNGKIYLPGGYTGVHITELSIYDIASNTWSTGAPLPVARSGMSAAYNGKIYVFGGNPGPFASIIVYDTATNTWSTSPASLPQGTSYGRAITVGSFMYVVGGINAVTANTVYRFDPATDTITTMAPLQTARTWEELMSDGTSIYAVAGGDATFFGGVPLAVSVEIYSIAGNTWTYGLPVVTKASSVAGGYAGGTLMIQGGVDTTVYLNTVQVSSLSGGGCVTPGTATPTNTAGTVVPSPTCAAGGITEGFESGLGAFTNVVATCVPGGCNWVSVASNPHGGTNSAFAPDGEDLSDQYLELTNPFVPSAGNTLSFWHSIDSEATFDGGVLEATTDNGTTWTDMEPNITSGGYDGPISTAWSSPISGRNAWNGSHVPYRQVSVNLTPYAGQNLRIRFRMATDVSVSAVGWNIDDVSIGGGCTTPTTPVPTATATACVPFEGNIGLGNPGKPNLVSNGTGDGKLASSSRAFGKSVSKTQSNGKSGYNPLGPVTFVLDDGVLEDAISLNNMVTNFPAIWINRFSPTAGQYPLTLNQISILFPDPSVAGADLTGRAIDLLVYLDTDGDNNPSNATKLLQQATTITTANGTTFSNYAVNVVVSGPGDVYVGFADTYNSGGVSPLTFPAAIDQTASQVRSWVSGKTTNEDPNYDDLSANDLTGTIDSFGLPGNWLIRASGTVGGGGGCPSPTPGTPQPTPTCQAGGADLIVDGSFEGGTPSTAWTEESTNFGTPLCDEAGCGNGGGSAGPRTGSWWSWFGGIDAVEDGAVSQTVNIPAGSATLNFYLWIGAHSGLGSADYVRALVGGTEVFRADDASTAYDAGYVLVSVDVSAQAGGSRVVRIESHNGVNGTGAAFNASVDDVSLTAGGGGCPTPGTPVVTATPTCQAGTGSWGAGADLPSTLTRAYGAYFPTNGKFYTLGGRTGDGDPALAQLQPLEYNPATNTWVQKTAVFSDVQTSNVTGGVLTVGGTPVIMVVGGSAGGGTGGTTETRMYDPVADTMTTVATDPWTPGLTTVPGGSAVFNNKLYVFGGFVINVGMSTEIWEYDPARAAGSRWDLKTAALPTALGYIPVATVGSFIYTFGGSEWDGTTLIDSAVAYKYDPTADTIVAVASTPRATGETRAVTYGGQAWIIGGGRVAPNPGNQVEIYDPATDTYTAAPSFLTPRRNASIDTDGTKIYMAGGYDTSGTTLIASLEIFSAGGGCASPTPGTAVPTDTPTIGPSPTDTTVVPSPTGVVTETSVPTAIPTSTVCPAQFTDVPVDHTFYANIRCLVCRGIISGYNTDCATGIPCFRPDNPVTRGQIAKMVSNSAGFTDTASGQQYQDVLPGSTFYDYIYRLDLRGYINGYPCGGPGEPCGGGNLPYFRTNASITRGQISKIVSNGAGLTNPAGAQQYEDVLPGSTFYDYIWRLTDLGVMKGYACGGPGEPCVGPGLPYFRPGANATRGQASKIVSNTFFPNCVTPFRPEAVSQK